MSNKDVLKDFPSLENSLKAIKKLNKSEFPFYDKEKYPKKEDYINEVYSIIQKEFLISPPNLLLSTKCKDFNFNLFRVREYSTFTDIDMFSEYSYPPINLTKMGRCNFPEKPVFYCSNNPITSLFETIRDDDFKNKMYCISKWNVNNTEEILLFENYLRSELPPDNEFKIFKELLDEKIEETFKGELSQNKKKGLIKYLEFIDTKFIEDNDYSVSSSIAYKSLFPIHNMGTDILMYPSKQTMQKGVNMAINPNFVDNHMNANRFYIIKVNKREQNNVLFEISFINYGIVNNRKIMWSKIKDNDLTFENIIIEDFGQSFYKTITKK
ncbi:hypothetical protein [Lacinutrix himadriensis]|uniref:hypothetical protein n=1 Tax=Lacinutrix himadriensis TaxID=641549 RepID=UPI0006E19AB4|nr:hypothetical protein [Lacinutrix himadriensis]